MGFRARKSFKIAPGIRMTVTPKGIGVSAGVKGARISANSSGRVTRTVGLPGTGIYHTETLSSGHTPRRRQPAVAAKRGSNPIPGTVPHAAPVPKAPTPGLFAPKWEKELHKAILGNPDYTSLPRIGTDHPSARPLASLLRHPWFLFPLAIRSVDSSC